MGCALCAFQIGYLALALDMPCVLTVDSAQDPPTKPSIVPSEKINASSPGLAEVGFSASTTRACTYGVRDLCRSATREARIFGTGHLPSSLLNYARKSPHKRDEDSGIVR